MKSFAQYISEDMPAISRSQPKGYDDKAYAAPTHIGSVGPYKVIHILDDILDGGSGVFHIMHKEKRVGYIPYGVQSSDTIQMEGPNLMHKHRGTKAKVKNLMPKVYGLISDKMKKRIISDTLQSRGGASIWRRLAGMRKVTVKHYNPDELPKYRIKGRYIPDQHEKIVYNRTHGTDYALVLHPRRGKKK